jgi:diguanylate cyclase (GGDEF)-like protein/PAS domain S-box-containing protein
MKNWSIDMWRKMVDAAPEGIVICDAKAKDLPAIYVNHAFTQLCGYPATALLGSNLRILQGADREQEGRQRLREAMTNAAACRILLRNYRPDGTVFWNEAFIQPLKNDAGEVTHWAGFHRDAGARLRRTDDRPAAGLPGWLREDRLTGLNSRGYFEEFLQRDWAVAQRESHEIGMVFFDIDALGPYNDTFDKAGGDACIRRVGRVIAGSYRRRGDLIGRWEGGTFAVLIQGDSADKAAKYARVVTQRVHDLLIHHPHGVGGERYVTLSAGVACVVPARAMGFTVLSNACRAALKRAKEGGRNTVNTAEPADLK